MKRSTLGTVVSVSVIVIWLFVVTFAYYIAHKPFSDKNVLAILNVLSDVFVAGVLFALAIGLGRRVLSSFDFASTLEKFVFQFGIGFGILSLTTFALGLAGLLYQFLFWILGVGGIFLLRNDLRAEWKQWRGMRWVATSRFERVLLGFIGVSLGLAFLVTLTPSLGWDAQMYHLLVGKIALTQGRITVPPDIPTLSYPSFVEMIYLAAMTLKGDGATPMLHLSFALLTVGALLAFSRRFLETQIGLLASAILLAVPSYLLVATWAYADVALTFYVFMAFYATAIAQENPQDRWLVLAGVCAGIALGIKYTALDLPIALMAMLWFGKRVPFKRWLWLLVPCGVIAAPWYLRNWVFMGNPLYPFFFGGRYWDDFRSSVMSLFGSGLLSQPWRIVLAPWEATILGQEGKMMYEATIGPGLLVTVPILIFVWRNEHTATTRTILRQMLVFSATLYLFWLAGASVSRSFIQSRYLYPVFPVLALLGAVACARLATLDLAQFSVAHFSRLWFGLILALTLFAQVMEFIQLNPLPYLAGFESRERFLATRLSPQGYWQALDFLAQQSSTQVIFLWEPRAYYAPATAVVLPDELLDRFAHLRFKYRDATTISDALRAEGYQYILLNRWGLEFQLADPLSGLAQSDVAVLKDILTRQARQVYGAIPFEYAVDGTGKISIAGSDDEPYTVYELGPRK